MRSLLGILDRWARWALPAGVLVGVVLPDLATLFRPLLTMAFMGTLTVALLRLDWGHLAEAIRRPAIPLAMAGWLLIASPLLTWSACMLIGLPPDMRLLLVLQAGAPPIGSAAAFAMILGLEGALAVVGALGTTLLLPLTLTPLVGFLLADTSVEVNLAAFFARATLIVLLPFALAWGLRTLVGLQRLARSGDLLGGINVLAMVIFAIAVMDGVTARLVQTPQFVGILFGMACVTTALLHMAGFLLFRRAGIPANYEAAILSGNRNMGLMLVVTSGTAGEDFSLYVGVAQIPMYFAPVVLMPLLKRSLRANASPRPDH